MADYYTNFSLNIALPGLAARTRALELFQRLEELRDDETRPDDLPEALWEVREDWHFECTSTGTDAEPSLWLHSSNGGIVAVCAFIQHLLHRFNLKEAVTFEWSHDCSKPRTDAYGGGAALITQDAIRTFNTADWVREQLEELKPHLFSPDTQTCIHCGVHSDDQAVAATPCNH